MTIYQLYDFDPMASNMGSDFIAKSFLIKKEAEVERDLRNAAYKEHWFKTQPENRHKETWSYNFCYIKEVHVE